MKKRWRWLLAVLALFGLLCVPEMAGAEAEEVKTDFEFSLGAGETIQPDYPDFSSLIGEGLTKDDFIISYSSRWSTMLVVDPVTGQVTIQDEPMIIEQTMYVYVTYTPVTEGVGKETVFRCTINSGEALKWIKPKRSDLTLGLGQSWELDLECNSGQFPGDLEMKGFDTNVVQASLEYFAYPSFYRLSITPVSVGETTITVCGYNGVSANVHIKVVLPPTKLSFAQEVFYGYVGDEINLGLDCGDTDCSPNLQYRVTCSPSAGGYTFRGAYRELFCPQDPVDYTIRAKTYNGFGAETVVKVYDRKSAVSLKANVDHIYEGDRQVKIQAYDVSGRELRIRKYEVTKGQDIAHMSENSLITTGAGQVEVTCTNYDGSTCSETFEVEVLATKIILNANEVTLEIGETFKVEVGFDKGELPYTWSDGGYTGDIVQGLYPARMEGNVITAQAPGTQTYIVRAGNMEERITVTVLDSDKAVHIALPPEPFPTGTPYQLYVCDRTGKIYPATFSARWEYMGKVTPGGYLTVGLDGNFGVIAKLADGRVLSALIETARIPKWIQRDAVVIRRSDSDYIGVMSDQGPIGGRALTFEVADETVLTIKDGDLKPKKIGKTTVTVRSKYAPEVSTTFTVEVIPDESELYIGITGLHVPYQSARTLPPVYDNNGKEVEMVWKITHGNPGVGNPEESGFYIKDNAVYSTWPTANCEVTGTVKGGTKKVKISVTSFQLPETISIDPEQVWLKPGEKQSLKLVTEDKHGGWGMTYWEAEKDGIVTMEPYVNGEGNTLTAVGSGETLVAAVLENGTIAMCLVNVYDPNERLPGDVNEDGVVDAKDALIIMQYSAGWPVKINGWQGDVNANGSTNLQDALLIFQHASGMDVELMQYNPAE